MCINQQAAGEDTSGLFALIRTKRHPYLDHHSLAATDNYTFQHATPVTRRPSRLFRDTPGPLLIPTFTPSPCAEHSQHCCQPCPLLQPHCSQCHHLQPECLKGWPSPGAWALQHSSLGKMHWKSNRIGVGKAPWAAAASLLGCRLEEGMAVTLSSSLPVHLCCVLKLCPEGQGRRVKEACGTALLVLVCPVTTGAASSSSPRGCQCFGPPRTLTVLGISHGARWVV